MKARLAFMAAVLACGAVRAACLGDGAAIPVEWRAKWIAAAAATRPPIDLGGAKWIANGETNVFVKAFELDAVPADVCELAFTTRDRFKVALNGIPVADTYWEHFHDWRWLRVLDVRPFLRCGTNELSFVVMPFPGEEPSLVARLDCGTLRIVSDGTWGREIDGFGVRGWRETESPAFAKAFDVKGAVRRAILHVTGVGFYEARMDGKKIGDKVLDPAPTDYSKRVLYSTYAIDGLSPGRHEISLLLGHGWYDQRSLSVWNFDNAPWRDFPRGIAQLEIEYADGSRETVATDRTWRQVKSPVRYDDIREGEIVEPSASGEIGFAEEVSPPAGRLVPETQPGARVVRTLKPESIRRTGEGEWVVAFPENVAGWMRMRMKGLDRGQVVSFTYDERLAADGSPAASSDWRRDGVWGTRDDGSKRMIDIFFVSSRSYEALPSSDAAFQRDRFVSGGRDGEVYEPRFTYHGFRYVTIRGMKAAPQPGDIEACVVSTDFAETGTFACSDAVFNRLMANAARSYRGNFVDGFPTDCPHREKNGWTGDASMASEFAQYRFDNTAGYEKWLADIRDAQRASGEIPCIVPTSGWGYYWGNGPGWDSALPVIAWDLYRHKGDVSALKECEQAIRRLCDFTAEEHVRDGLVDWGIGDHAYCGPADSAVTREFAVSCFAMRANEIAAQAAEALDHGGEGERYSRRVDEIRRALRTKYRRAPGIFDNGGQTAQAMAIAFGVAGADERAAAGEALVNALAEKGDHLDVGVYGMRFVPEALSMVGRTDLAFKALTQTTYPSPACWLRDGSTTLWESWNGDASRNHVMFGSFGGWAYAHLAGIRPIEPGYRKFMLAPEPIEALTHVSATVETPFGKVASAWKRMQGALVYSCEVPPGTTAEVRLPGAKPTALGPGAWTFVNGKWGDADSMRAECESLAAQDKSACADAMPDVDSIMLEGDYAGHLQDVCRDGRYIYWAHTLSLVKTDLSGRMVAKVDVDGHHAGLEVKDGKVYVAVCAMQNKTGGKTLPDSRVTINVYDAETLKLMEEHVTEINDRSGSLAVLDDGTFLVGCLRPPDISASQVRFHHLDGNYKLIKSYLLDKTPVPLGIETIKGHGGCCYLSLYTAGALRFDQRLRDSLCIKLDGEFREIARYSVNGTCGLVFDGDNLWVGLTWTKEGSRRWVSSLNRIKRPDGF